MTDFELPDISDLFADSAPADAVPLRPVDAEELAGWLVRQPEHIQKWIESTGFAAKTGKLCYVPGDGGRIETVLAGVSDDKSQFDIAHLVKELPEGSYVIEGIECPSRHSALALGWALGGYGFSRYKEMEAGKARLVWPALADRPGVEAAALATILARDLINTPAEDMGPSQLADAARKVAEAYGAEFSVIVGDDLLTANYPAIHAVGRASDDPPRLIDMVWGDANAPKVTLVGKGVCFDTGGLDLKPASGMKLMKKDMGGAAIVLGLATMIMRMGLPVRLRVLIPAVENNVAGNAIRPLDVIKTRKGLTVEIGNTDAEGRVILADALAEGASEEPQIMVDFATLTGAARVALGAELPALFCDDDDFTDRVLANGKRIEDPLWRLPLWSGYRKQIDGKVADITNAPEGGFGGAITAALFLKEFVAGADVWAHIDVMAWNQASRPGRPEGGEAMGMRTFYTAIRDHLASKE